MVIFSTSSPQFYTFLGNFRKIEYCENLKSGERDKYFCEAIIFQMDFNSNFIFILLGSFNLKSIIFQYLFVQMDDKMQKLNKLAEN